MAYQNVGTPRFYINLPEWYSANGAFHNPENIFNTLPVKPMQITSSTSPPYNDESTRAGNNVEIYPNEETGINALPYSGFVAILGHSIVSPNYFEIYQYDDNFVGGGAGSMESLINAELDGQQVVPDYVGFTIVRVGSATLRGISIGSDALIGSIVIGSYYDMPHSPDLKLTMTREMDGVKRVRTKGGSDLVGYNYHKPAMWGGSAAWELSSFGESTYPEHILSRSGRRTWDLSFSYLDDGDVFGSNQLSSMEGMGAIAGLTGSGEGYDAIDLQDDGNDFAFNILTDNNFYSQVIHKTNGGQLPFIFQPDSANSNPDNFAICKFDMNTFKFKQVANGVYDVRLKIREVW